MQCSFKRYFLYKSRKKKVCFEHKTKLIETEFKELDFICKKKYEKNGILMVPKVKPCSVAKEKVESILQNLKDILPENRKLFWVKFQYKQ
jgi:hypothetical protein